MIHWERRNGERKCNPCPPSWRGRSRSRGIPSRCFHATRLVDRIKTKKSKVFPQPHWLVVALATGPLSSSVNPAEILGEADNGHGFPSIDVPKKIPRRRIHLAAVWAEPALDCIKLASANFHVAELGPEVPRRWLISTQGERRESASRKNVRLAAPTPAVSHLNNAPDIQCLHGECYWCCRQRTEIRSDPIRLLQSSLVTVSTGTELPSSLVPFCYFFRRFLKDSEPLELGRDPTRFRFSSTAKSRQTDKRKRWRRTGLFCLFGLAIHDKSTPSKSRWKKHDSFLFIQFSSWRVFLKIFLNLLWLIDYIWFVFVFSQLHQF